MAAVPVTPRFDELAGLVSSAFNVKLEPFQYTSDRFDELLKDGRTCPEKPAPDQMKTVRLLADRSIRTAALAIKASLGLLVSDLPKQLPADARGDSDRIRNELLDGGLVQSEIVVICRKTSGQIARFPTLDVVESASKQGVKCACGRIMRDERCEEALAISQMGYDLLEHSRWFSLLLLDELLRLGVPIDRITLEHQAGGDEMDCLADVSGDLIFFELKDKEFSLGNAYSFGAKIGLLRPKHAVIVTTETVGGDAKDHFQRAEAAQRSPRRVYLDPFEEDELAGSAVSPITYIEGLDRLRSGLADIVTGIYSVDSARLLGDAAGFGSVSPQSLLKAVRQAPVPGKVAAGANGARKAKAPI